MLRVGMIGIVLALSGVVGCRHRDRRPETPTPATTEAPMPVPVVFSAALAPGAPSFFQDADADEIYVGLITDAQGSRAPFTWDCDGSLIAFLHRREEKGGLKFQATHDEEADPNYGGTRIVFEGVPAVLLRDGKTRKMTLESWRRIDAERSECGANAVYPSVHFRLASPVAGFGRDVREAEGVFFLWLDDARSDRFESLSGTPRPHIRTTTGGEALEGRGLDVDGDDCMDLFWYYESVSETAGYLRLYMNVRGVWQLRWIYHHQECP